MRTLKIVLTEDNGEITGNGVPVVRSATREISDGEIKAAVFGKRFDLIAEISKLSKRIENQVPANKEITCGGAGDASHRT